MLELVARTAAKRAAQTTYRRAIHASLPGIGLHEVGFQGDNVTLALRGEGDQGLWYNGRAAQPQFKTPRHLNSFGLYRAGAASQDIIVEINVPSETKH